MDVQARWLGKVGKLVKHVDWIVRKEVGSGKLCGGLMREVYCLGE